MAILEEDAGGLSIHPQKDLNDTAMSGNLKKGYGMIFSNISVSAKILFSFKTDNPKTIFLAKKIRRTVFFAFLTPLIIMFALIFVTSLMQ